MSDPSEPHRKLKKRLRQELDAIGIDLVNFSISPADEAGQIDVGYITMEPRPDAFLTDEQRAERKQFDDQFAELEASLRDTPNQPKSQAPSAAEILGIGNDDGDDGGLKEWMGG